VGDNLMTTYHNADHAVDALLRLETLVNTHNVSPGEMPRFSYTAVICKGDLFMLTVGVNGPLVGHSFRLLEHVTHGEKALEETVYLDLKQYRERFVQRPGTDSKPLYYLAEHKPLPEQEDLA
jgi:hypothetical protein